MGNNDTIKAHYIKNKYCIIYIQCNDHRIPAAISTTTTTHQFSISKTGPVSCIIVLLFQRFEFSDVYSFSPLLFSPLGFISTVIVALIVRGIKGKSVETHNSVRQVKVSIPSYHDGTYVNTCYNQVTLTFIFYLEYMINLRVTGEWGFTQKSKCIS